MASINGISLKKVTNFKGHEGEPCYQGDVYLNNKKIGFWSQDTWGAIVDNVCLELGYSEKLLRDKVKDLNVDKARHIKRADGSTDTIHYSLESLFSSLLALQDDEKEFKRAVKVGYKGLAVVSDGYHIIFWRLSDTDFMLSDEELYKKLNVDKKKKDAHFFEDNEYFKHTFKVYRSGFDFNVGEKISLEDIVRKGKLSYSPIASL